MTNKKEVMTIDMVTLEMFRELSKLLYYTQLARGEASKGKLIDISDRLYEISSAIENCSINIVAIQDILDGKKEDIRLKEVN